MCVNQARYILNSAQYLSNYGGMLFEQWIIIVQIVSIGTGYEVHSNVTPHPLVGIIQWRQMGITCVSGIFFFT